MQSAKITQLAIDALKSGKYDQVRINFPNPDMVGHTGDLDATIEACTTVDACVKVRTEFSLMFFKACCNCQACKGAVRIHYFPKPDMVGRTGDPNAAVKACNTMDACVYVISRPASTAKRRWMSTVLRGLGRLKI